MASVSSSVSVATETVTSVVVVGLVSLRVTPLISGAVLTAVRVLDDKDADPPLPSSRVSSTWMVSSFSKSVPPSTEEVPTDVVVLPTGPIVQLYVSVGVSPSRSVKVKVAVTVSVTVGSAGAMTTLVMTGLELPIAMLFDDATAAPVAVPSVGVAVHFTVSARSKSAPVTVAPDAEMAVPLMVHAYS